MLQERKVQFRQGADLQRAENEKLELNTEIQRLTRKITELQTWQGREQSDSDTTSSKFPSDMRKEVMYFTRNKKPDWALFFP